MTVDIACMKILRALQLALNTQTLCEARAARLRLHRVIPNVIGLKFIADTRPLLLKLMQEMDTPPRNITRQETSGDTMTPTADVTTAGKEITNAQTVDTPKS